MLFRKRINDFIDWKNNENTALLVKGARQVGKTHLIEEFIKNEFDNFIEIDFTKDLNALDYLLEMKNYDDFINRLSLISNVELRNSNSVLFLDEIQYYYEIREKRIEADPSFKEKYVDIITLSKTIVNNGEFRLIMSGSMLGISVFNVNLNPTGYLKTLDMYPMDFEEFLLANNIKQELINETKQAFINKEAVSDSINELFIKKFREYVIIGGLPKAVEGYVNDKSLSLTESALDTVNNWYKEDIVKYAKKEDRLVILEMYNLLSSEITKKNRKFVKSHMDVPNFKNLDLSDRFLWLKGAAIAIPTYNITNPVYPLRISKDSKIVKLFMGDVGLLSHSLFDKTAKKRLLVNDDPLVDLGAFYENAAAELLLAHGYDPYFFSNKKRGEVDFVIEKNMAVYPIEIKSGKPNKKNGYYEHSALDNILLVHKEIKESWIFGVNNVKKEKEGIYMFPIYMIDFVRKQ